MGVGKAVYVVTCPQAQCELRMDHVARPLHASWAEKRERILISYSMSQTLSI